MDRLRREATGRQKLATFVRTPTPEPSGDDRLALVFACCHPALSEPSQTALTLNAVVGLPAETIAAAFLPPQTIMAQRLVRAKRQLRERGVRVEMPPPEEYASRLPAVLAVIYLIYIEGYLATSREAAWSIPEPASRQVPPPQSSSQRDAPHRRDVGLRSLRGSPPRPASRRGYARSHRIGAITYRGEESR